jgi:ubiquinone/menaquinone biosynthesis C-methylase UbiE
MQMPPEPSSKFSTAVDVTQQADYWNRIQKRKSPVDPVIAAFVVPKLNYMTAHIKLPPAPHILDVGCGNGYFTYYLARLGHTIGLDNATQMLRLNPHKPLVQGSVFELPFTEGQFDLVFCANLLHHLPEPVQALRELHRVSRRHVVLCEPNRNNPAMLLLSLIVPEERAAIRFTQPLVKRFAQQAGLTVLTSATMGFVTPNRMPRPLAKIGAMFTRPNPVGAYIVLVAQVDQS